MYQIAICDDDRRFVAEFHRSLNSVLAAKKIEARIEIFHDTASFLEKMYDGVFFDLIFLDILLEEENGYSFARKLRDKDIKTDIIFITSTEDYAIMGYDVSPLFYLVKPFTEKQLTYALNLFLKKHTPDRLVLNLPGEILSLNIVDLIYCEVFGHRTCLHMASGESREIRYSLGRLEKHLPPGLFVRSHQSYLVNMEHIVGIARYKITLSTGQTLPVSQPRYLEMQNNFLLFASRQKIRI